MNSGKKSGDQQQQDQQQQPSNPNRNNRPELTAEWTVHAQLTISRPDKESTADDQQNPLRVVYKWSSDNTKPSTFTSGNEDQTRPYQETSDSTPKDQHDSFHSTATTTDKLPSDSGLSSSNTSRKPYGARCKSTCSIVLSAVADFLPSATEIPEEPDPFYFNTTSTYNVLPDQTTDDPTNVSQNFGSTKTLSLRDAFCQTSDTESTKLRAHSFKSSANSKYERKPRQTYDYRRQTESMLPPPVVDEGDPFLPSYTKGSPQQPYYSSQTNLRTPGSGMPTAMGGLRADSEGRGGPKSDTTKKPPRTVHIDVYCTGSDAEDDDEDDVDDASSQSSSNNPNEIESNSTPQTVFDTEQMHLRHQRAGKNELPRRLMAQSQQQQQHYQQQHQQIHSKQQPQSHLPSAQTHAFESDSPIGAHLGHVLSHSNTADEISESKQILFKKHIGDQRNKFNFRNRYFRRDQSDDAISSNYPNSSRSTMRDMTCSSISSAIASTSAIYEDVDTSWKEIEPEIATVTSLGKSDSFEYDNSIDRMRIRKMETLWSQPVSEHRNDLTVPQNPQQKRIQDFLQSYHRPPRTYHDTLSSEYEHVLDSDHPYFFNRSTIPERDEPVDQLEVPATPQTHRMTLRSGYTTQPQTSAGKSAPGSPGRLIYGPEYVKSGSETSTLLSNLSGYTTDYLQKARRFGAVVTALRKPGHHVGPAKNPDCQCEHCRRWMAERVEGRGRAYSTGDTPFSQSHFWLRRSTPGV
ncbi:uncharacterized protein LOC119652767 [Hermetia illucens]|uniref:uncharacterized protein LOC119652767 n=1 Tax=Hermetia illucens TaxID=343691 RepID=UPI0018CC2595|nr:uncharacterized protein LOC119652767 [Hermetia illucens]XP_037913014.1 uncharacterized protein LOC119652767 [Hermetia illucens]XP_037913023.1 uncharacterized protein LOC119652767 [Hermetia illucens]XP_037913030.1 uncharacterized protein LOC119652767 [Hermetia illucens]XP_037913036.1 uncharacterized protein LOC119652767 [Hermetia illucens]XP_037913044.1 uncharacterized protein LOC119652767 [Hermetia illucens]XP_037913051.1 uncharacterized protein LOC119652767 [Hermetia illucens]